MRRIAALISVFLLSGIGGHLAAATIAQAREAASAAQPPAPARAARRVKEESRFYSFAYGYPAAAAAIPELKAKLDADLEMQRRELADEAREDAAHAEASEYRFHPYARSFDWKVVTELPGWLSLSTQVSTYTGGAHPNYWFDAILWDKAANRERDALDLFSSKAALSAAIRRAFCAEIDRQRVRKRGRPLDRAGGGSFDDCLDPVGYTLILGSSDRKAFNRMGVLVPPYEAGPYSEGEYEVTLPVTRAVIAAVKPEFRSSFAIKR